MKKEISVSPFELLTNVSNHLLDSISLDSLLPVILSKIQSHLNCDQVFICYFNPEGEEEIISHQFVSSNRDQFKQVVKNYFQDEAILNQASGNHTNSDEDEDEVTRPLIKSELTFPIVLKSKELTPFLLQDLWGILFIYDYDHTRVWQKKEINTISLIVKQIIVAIERNIVYERLQLKKQEIEELQLIDQLTQLPNYKSFIDCLDFEWLRMAREKEPFSLIMIDVNSEHNPQQQFILPRIAKCLVEIIRRPSDLSARYSETRFAIILPETDYDGANVVARKIYNLIKKTLKEEIDVVVKIGVINCIPKPNSDYHQIINAAENSIEEAIENNININGKVIK